MPGFYPSQGALGRLCNAGCGVKLPRALNDAGIEAHPCCGPSELALLTERKPAPRPS